MVNTQTTWEKIQLNVSTGLQKIVDDLLNLQPPNTLITLIGYPTPEELQDRLFGAYALLRAHYPHERVLEIMRKEIDRIISESTGNDQVSVHSWLTYTYLK